MAPNDQQAAWRPRAYAAAALGPQPAARRPGARARARRLRDPHAAISAAVGPREPRRAKASAFQGLSKKFNRWKALIKIHGKRKEIASFGDEAEAARCYDRHATLAWGARCAPRHMQSGSFSNLMVRLPRYGLRWRLANRCTGHAHPR